MSWLPDARHPPHLAPNPPPAALPRRSVRELLRDQYGLDVDVDDAFGAHEELPHISRSDFESFLMTPPLEDGALDSPRLTPRR